MKATIRYDKDFVIGRAEERMAGSFVEHLNRCVYDGIYELGHPKADALGFREDVKELIRRTGIRALRYPGGNFASAYHWKDGIGPREARPRRFDPAWRRIETNQVGIDEFARYAKEVHAEMLLTVNLGTGTPQEAAELVEYCNLPGGTEYSDLRRKNGAEAPHDVRLWYLGNEMDGPWQMGQMSAHEYAVKCRETAKMMKAVSPEIELVACGSCSNEIGHRTYGIWDRIVLEEVYEQVDYLSLHRYYGYDIRQEFIYPRPETRQDGPWMPVDLEEMITTILGVIDSTKGLLHSRHQVHLCFDELSMLPRHITHDSGAVYDAFTQYAAVIYGALLCVLLNHADRIKVHCQSLIVNENGLFSTLPMGGVIEQCIAYPYRHLAECVGGTVLRPCADYPRIRTEHYGDAPCAASACVYMQERGEVRVLVSNLSLDEPLELELQLTGFERAHLLEHVELYHEDPEAMNTHVTPDAVRPVSRSQSLSQPIRLRPHSWNLLRITVKGEMENETGRTCQ